MTNWKKYLAVRPNDNPTTPFSSELVNIHLKTDEKLYGRRPNGTDFPIGWDSTGFFEIPQLDLHLSEWTTENFFEKSLSYSWKDTKDGNKFLDYNPQIVLYRLRDKKKSIVTDAFDGNNKKTVYKKKWFVTSTQNEWANTFPLIDKPDYWFKKFPTDWAIYEIPFHYYNIATPFQIWETVAGCLWQQFTIKKIYTFWLDNSAWYLVTDYEWVQLWQWETIDWQDSWAQAVVHYSQSQYPPRHTLVTFEQIWNEHFRKYTELRFANGSRPSPTLPVPWEVLVWQDSWTEMQVKEYNPNTVGADGSLRVLWTIIFGVWFNPWEEIIGDAFPSSYILSENYQSTKYIPRWRKSTKSNWHYFIAKIVCENDTQKKHYWPDSRVVNVYNWQRYKGMSELPYYVLKGSFR